MSKSVGELRAELKALRKEHPDHMPVSKMKKNDITDVIEKMKRMTETTPSVVLDKEIRAEATHKAQEKKQPKAMKESKAPKEKVGTEKIKQVLKELNKEESNSNKESKAKKDKSSSSSDEKPSAKESVAERMARVRAGKSKK
jgi:hypothetical protein